MQLDDLLGLLFLFFFVILPAIQAFMRRGRQLPDDFEPDQIPLPGEERQPTPPRPASTPPAQTSAPAPSRPPAPTPPPSQRPSPAPVSPQQTVPPLPPRPSKPKAGKTLEQIERERLARAEQNRAPAQPKPPRPSQPPRVPPPPPRSGQHWEFSNTPRDIVNGVVWHQILAEPRSQYWRRIRKPRR